MPSLENLTSKIIQDSQEKANSILKEARLEEERILREELRKAEEKKINIMNKANLEAKSKKSRIISNAKLSVRNKKLEAKQKILHNIYKGVLEQLMSLTKDEYLSFIRNSIVNLNIDGNEKIILSKDEININEEFIKNINEELKDNGKVGEIKLNIERRNFKGGFILAKNGIEINNTFEALIFSLKDEVEPQIIDILFS